MIKQGKIKWVGEMTREFKTQQGEPRYTYPVVVSLPYARQDGKVGTDEVVCDYVCGNTDHMKALHALQKTEAECDLTIALSVREWEGRKFTNIRLCNISQRMGV